MNCRDSSSSSSLSSSESCAEITAALNGHSQLGASLDLSLLTLPAEISHGSAGQQAQPQPSLLQHTRQDNESLSAGSSQLSVASAAESQHMQLAGNDGEQQQQQHKQRQRQRQQQQQAASQSGEGCLSGPEVGETTSRLAETECGPSSFMQRLQDFKRGTDALRRQVHAS